MNPVEHTITIGNDLTLVETFKSALSQTVEFFAGQAEEVDENGEPLKVDVPTNFFLVATAIVLKASKQHLEIEVALTTLEVDSVSVSVEVLQLAEEMLSGEEEYIAVEAKLFGNVCRMALVALDTLPDLEAFLRSLTHDDADELI